MSLLSVIFQNGWQVHQSGSISHKKRHHQTLSKEGTETFFAHLHEGKRPHARAEPCWKWAVPLEPGRSPAPQRGACWEGERGPPTAAGGLLDTAPRRRDVPLTLMVKTGGTSVSSPAGAAVNTCRLAATDAENRRNNLLSVMTKCARPRRECLLCMTVEALH